MLPLWRDRLHIVLAPDRVSIARLGGGFKPGTVFSKTISCTSSAPGEPLWQPVIRAMKQLLQQSGAGKADAIVLLSNHFVRYQLVATQPDLGSLEEEQAFVRFSFSEVYGDEVNQWALRWGNGLDWAAQVASAIDQDLIDQLEKALTVAGAKLVSLQPYMMGAFNHVRKLIGKQAYWFVLVEPGRACLAMLRDGRWEMMHATRLGEDWADDFPRVLEREFQIVGPDSAGGNMVLCLPGHFDRKRLAFGNQSLRILMMTPEMLLQGDVQPIASVEVQQ